MRLGLDLALLSQLTSTMPYQFQQILASIWKKAVSHYQSGKTDPENFPIEDDLLILASWGISKMDVFDFVEDWCLHKEPDLMTFVMVHSERRAYFWEEQKGIPSDIKLDPSKLPAKSAETGGYAWLPRILPKARAKLRGELPPEVMFGCGGDREFFRANDIHPADFLRVVRRYEQSDQSIVNWVANRKI